MKLSIEVKVKEATERALRKAANDVRDKMIDLAKSNLSSRTAQIYINSLSKVKMSGGEAEFHLKGWLPNAIEKGCEPFDMKIGMLASPKAKISKKGNPYLRVPIESEGETKILTVSKASKPGSWIHPGIIPRDFFGKALYQWKSKRK